MDRHAKSETLNVVLSFSWRPSLVAKGENIRKTLKRWSDYERFSLDDVAANTPDFLLVGNLLENVKR